MEIKLKKQPSWAVIRRMPKYYRYICNLSEAGEAKISSGALAAMMGLTASQVRQDFNCFGDFGQQGYGYPVEELKRSIAAILSIDRQRAGIVVGAGHLGHALITNFSFAKCGVRIIAAFDIKQELVGTSIGETPVLHTGELEDFIARHKPEIAVLTLAKAAAPDMATLLGKNGVKGIWNFTNIDLEVPSQGTQIENVHFDESLMVLAYRLEVPEQEGKEG